MILLGSSLINAPVMGLQTGGELARTTYAVINPTDLSIVAYEVSGDLLGKKSRLLRIADVRELSDLGFIVDSIDEFVESEDIVKIHEIHKLNFHLVGMRVVDEHKRRLGKVIDYTFETGGFVVQQLTVQRPLLRSLNDTELLIHRSQIIEINDDGIVVHSTAKVPEPKRNEVTGSYVNPFRKTSQAPESIITRQR